MEKDFKTWFKVRRARNGETLETVANFLGSSISYVSEVESGKKPVPEEWYAKLVAHYQLNEEEQNELRLKIDRSKRNAVVDFSGVLDSVKDVANELSKKAKNIDEETAKSIKKLLSKVKKS